MSMKAWKELDSDEIIEKLEETIKLDSEIFDFLSNYDDYEVREIIAKRLDTPKEILTKLSNDEDYDVVAKVAKNPNTSLDVIEHIKKKYKKLPDILDAIICRELPEDWKFLENDEIIDKLNSEVISNEVLKILSKLENAEIKTTVAGNKSTSIEILKKLSQDDDFGVLEAVVNNSKTPVELKEYLMKGDFKDYYESINGSFSPVEIKLNLDEKLLKEIKLSLDQESEGDDGDIYESGSWEISDDEYGVNTEEVSRKSIIIWAMPRSEDKYKIKIEYRYYNENSEIITDVSIGSYDVEIGIEKKDLIQLDIALGEYIDNGGKLSDLNFF